MTTTTLAPVGDLIVHNCDEEELRDPWLEWDGMAGYYTRDDLAQLIADYGRRDWRVIEIHKSGYCSDADGNAFEWECLLDEITDWMKEITPPQAYYGYWQGYVRDFGWLHQNGEKQFKAEDGQHFLWAILPDTDCHFKVFKCEDATGRQGLAIQNWHHDTGPGGEWYYIFAEIEVEEDEDEEREDA